MHDVSLGHTLEDYCTGEALEATTYEDLRQGLARLLVEERGWPRSRLRPRLPIKVLVGGEPYIRLADLAALDEAERPLCLVDFCPGEVSTFVRETLAAARCMAPGPAPLAVITDTRDAFLLATGTGEELARGMQALPRWEQLLSLAATHALSPLPAERLEREARILRAYSESRHACCVHAAECQARRREGA